MAKLRILYNNLVKSTTLTASSSASAALAIANVQNDTKTSIWRSGVSGTASSTISMAFSTAQSVSCIAMPFCNFKTTKRADITLYSDTAYVTPITAASSTNYQIVRGATLGDFTWSQNTLGVNAFSYGLIPYGSWYTPDGLSHSVGSIKIILYDTDITAPAAEIGMLLAGQYQSPAVNFDTNPEFGLVDTTKQERTDAGNIIVNRGTLSKNIAMTLSYIQGTGSGLDKNMLLGIQAFNGLSKPIFASLFPEDADADKEQMYQIYGFMKQLNPFGQQYNDIYSTSIDITEV